MVGPGGRVQLIAVDTPVLANDAGDASVTPLKFVAARKWNL